MKMKNRNRFLKLTSFIFVFLGLLFSSCNDYLDKGPLDELSEAVYFKTPADFEAASNFFYTRLGFDYGDAGSDLSGNIGYGGDIVYGNGYTTIPSSDEIWTNNYKYLRYPNQLIEKAADYEGDGDISEYVSVAYFFRAWHHLKLLKRFGGVPIVTRALSVDSEELYAPRNSRYEVVAQILSDIDAALPNLRSVADMSDGEQGRITKEAAKSLKAHVLLFEGTWEKYADNAFLDGDGSSVGAGSVKPAGYPSVTQMLTDAKTLSKEIIDGGQFELWDKRAELQAVETLPTDHFGERHLYYFFNLEPDNNPAGLTKADNKEFIFQAVFDYNYRRINQNLTHSHPVCPTRKLMDMYLCTDGLPVQHSTVFEGYDSILHEYQNRDLRLTGLNKIPFRQYWGWNSPNTSQGGGAQYGVPFEESGVDYDYRYSPQLRSEVNGRNMGYMGNKFTFENINRDTRYEAFNCPIIRYAEILLIYAEATCELGNGSISDGDLNISINKIRERSGVAPLTNALIAPFSDLTMLGEIRRERGIELFGEGFRFDDLKRWGIAETELKHDICVTYIKYGADDTEYVNAIDPRDGDPLYTPETWSFGLTTAEASVSTYSGIAKTKAGALIINPASNRLFAKMNYLDPIPSAQIGQNPALKQNPGW